MRTVIGCIFILAGLALASSLLPFARQQDLASTDAAWSDRDEEWSTKVTVAGSGRVAETQPPPNTLVAPSSPVVVTIHQVPQSQSAPIPFDRVTLVRELQRELGRVGCYSGPLNGVWTTSTRTAMKSFTDRVNAILPVENPDAILLSLVRSHQGQGCGSCPAGQSLAKNGRCLPVAILAHAGKKGAPEPTAAISGWTITTTAAAPTPAPLLADRMALAGPGSEAVASETPPAAPANKTARAERAYERRGPLTPTYSRRSGLVESIFSGRNNY
jgi:hypothetical protein